MSNCDATVAPPPTRKWRLVTGFIRIEAPVRAPCPATIREPTHPVDFDAQSAQVDLTV